MPESDSARRRPTTFAHGWACALWQVSDCRVHRWRARRRDAGILVDKAPGGHPVHALLPEEVAVILDLTERWGAVDRSHRKLAPRGSYQQLVWCRRPASVGCSSSTGSPCPNRSGSSTSVLTPSTLR